jgi:HEAT repeat protein
VKSVRLSFHTIAVLCLWAGGLRAADLPALARNLVSNDAHQRETAGDEASGLPFQEQKRLAARLASLLKGTDTDRREYAAEALKKLGAAAAPAIPALQANLGDDFPYVRIHSAEALAGIGPAATPAFMEALKNDNQEVRLVAIQALAHLGGDARPAIPLLVQALNDREGAIRQHAITALTNTGAEAIPALMQALENPTFKNRIGLVKVLGVIDGTPAQLPGRLTPYLSDPDPDLRLAAMKALTHKGQTAVSAVSLRLRSENPLVRAESCDILADIGPKAVQAVPLLIDLLHDTDGHVRAVAAHALGKMGSAGAAAVPALREALKDTDRNVTARAQEALTAITVTLGSPNKSKEPPVLIPAQEQEQPPAPPVQPKPALKPKPAPSKKPVPSRKPIPASPPAPVSFLKLDSTASLSALEMTARKSGPETRTSALTALAALLQNPDEKIRGAAAIALQRIGTEEALKILAPYRKQEEVKKMKGLMLEIQISTGPIGRTIDALAAMGPIVIPTVTQALKDPKTGVRLAAADIITRLGPAASAAAPRLIEALNDPEEAVRRQSAKALETMNRPEAKNPLRLYHLKEMIRPTLKRLRIFI